MGELRGSSLSSPLKLHGGKADPQKCIYDVSGSESSPETDADLPLEEDKKGEETEPQMSGGLGKSDVFPAVDSPMDDLEQTEDIKVSYGQRSDSWRNMRKFMDDDSMDSTKNKNDNEDISDMNMKKSLEEERQNNIAKPEKTEANVMSLDISELLKKEGNEANTKNLK